MSNLGEKLSAFARIITEDSNAGHQMIEHIAGLHSAQYVSANGKSNIFQALTTQAYSRVLAVADGAAFGTDMEKVYQKQYPGRVTLYLPESFEWLVLKAGIIRSSEINEVQRIIAYTQRLASLFSRQNNFIL